MKFNIGDKVWATPTNSNGIDIPGGRSYPAVVVGFEYPNYQGIDDRLCVLEVPDWPTVGWWEKNLRPRHDPDREQTVPWSQCVWKPVEIRP